VGGEGPADEAGTLTELLVVVKGVEKTDDVWGGDAAEDLTEERTACSKCDEGKERSETCDEDWQDAKTACGKSTSFSVMTYFVLPSL
jgi:hypothetical protein